MEAQHLSEGWIVRIGAMMCVVWLGAASMLIWQVQATGLAHNGCAGEQSLLVRAN